MEIKIDEIPRVLYGGSPLRERDVSDSAEPCRELVLRKLRDGSKSDLIVLDDLKGATRWLSVHRSTAPNSSQRLVYCSKSLHGTLSWVYSSAPRAFIPELLIDLDAPLCGCVYEVSASTHQIGPALAFDRERVSFA